MQSPEGVKGLALVGALLEFADKHHPDIGQSDDVADTSARAIITANLECGHDATRTHELVQDTEDSAA